MMPMNITWVNNSLKLAFIDIQMGSEKGLFQLGIVLIWSLRVWKWKSYNINITCICIWLSIIYNIIMPSGLCMAVERSSGYASLQTSRLWCVHARQQAHTAQLQQHAHCLPIIQECVFASRGEQHLTSRLSCHFQSAHLVAWITEGKWHHWTSCTQTNNQKAHHFEAQFATLH